MTPKYQVIYADPPFAYRHCASNNRRIENQYSTMKLEDIKSLVVPSADDSVLYLWAMSPKLEEALEVLRAWGFDYRTHAVWDKEIIGMGYWFRQQHEDLLVGVKGKFSPPDPHLRVSSIIKSRRQRHSIKPQVVMDLIDQWYPEATKLEMFSRQKRLGWDCVGNAIAGEDIRVSLARIIAEQGGQE